MGETLEEDPVIEEAYMDSDPKHSFNHYSYFAQFVFLLTLFLLGLIISSLVGALAIMPFYGKEEVFNLGTLIQQKGINLNPIRFLQMFSTIGTFVFPALIFSRLKTGKPFSYVQINRKIEFRLAFAVPGLVLFLMPLVMIIYTFNKGIQFPTEIAKTLKMMEEQATKAIEVLLDSKDTGIFIINFIMIALLPAFCEEIFFRGTVQRFFTQWLKNPHIGILIGAVIFSFVHMEFYGFLPRVVLGILFGYMFYWSKNIWYPILAHLFNNGMQVIGIFLEKTGRINADITDQTAFDAVTTITFTIMFLALCSIFYAATHRKELIHHE